MIKTLLRFLVPLLLIAAPLAAQEKSGCDSSRWYCVSGLNTGLPQPSTLINRETPRATIESLIAAAREDAWTEAAHLLDLSGIPEVQQLAAGTGLARQLETVVSRKTVIDWDIILDRPDALDARASSDRAMAGEPRKSLLLWTLELDNRPVAIRLNRIKPEDGAAVWVFSRQTVGNIPALFARFGPGRFEKMLPDALKENAAFGFKWWEVLGLPLLLALSAGAGWLVWKGMGWAARKASHQVVTDTLLSIRGPASIGSATLVALAIGSYAFVFSGQISTVLPPLAWLGLAGSGLWLAINSVEAVLDRLTSFDETDLTQRQEDHKRTMATRLAAARRAFVVAAVLIGGGIFLSQSNIFQNLGFTILGTAGALTLILGFAARRVLGNIIASLQIALNQSAKIGDRIVYNDYLCHVERINFTYVQLRDWDGTRLIVPVEEFISTPFENWTMKEPKMLRIIKLKCAHNADVDALREAFDDIVGKLDKEELGDPDDAKVRVAGQDVFGKDVWFALPCADPNTSWDVACKAREMIIAAGNRIAEERNIDIFPEVRPAEAA
ncbi:mechanosensitive ion channel family protein [Leisingera caerulea]|uniref:mechanosensitive ion channel family protein n=1 Tax=Leisingera caerulea TaxID=506591 RepID=UPI0003F880E3|nr:mechanosensitive ion channel domain-containing protein [Leisingera caerulea]